MRVILLLMLLAVPAGAQMLPRLSLFPVAAAAVDPFPLRRIALAAGQLPPASAGKLQMLPLAEFNTKLQHANAAPATILTAAYSATLDGSDLVGEGTLRIAATGSTALTLGPLSIAIAEPKWKAGAAATLDRSRAGTRLWIDAASGRELTFRWSARGREEPGILRYDLRLPTVAIAVLELDLPHDRSLSTGDALVSGPHPSAKPNVYRWRIAFGGRSKLDLAIVNPAAAASGASFSRSAKYDITAGTGTLDFDIDALRGPCVAWSFRVDPDVRVVDVVTPNRDPWRYDAIHHLLTVTLRDPANHGRVSILTAFSVPESGPAWPCAGVHGVGAIGSDTIELRVGADPRLVSWDPGDYTLTRTAPLTERGVVLVFNGSWRTKNPQRKPPAIVLSPVQPSTSQTIDLDWQLSPTRNRVAVRVEFAVQSGPVLSVGFKLPAGYTAGTVRFSPDDVAATVTANTTTLTMEPSRPWTTGQVVEARFDLIGPPIVLDQPIPIPRLVPEKPIPFDGTLTVNLETGLSFPGRGDRTLEQPYTSRDGESSLVIVPTPTAVPAVTPNATAPSTWDFNADATATIDEAGTVRVRLVGTVHRAGATVLPITLPTGSIVQSATVNGKYVDHAAGESILQLPVAGVPEEFEVLYSLPAQLRGLVVTRPDVTATVLDRPIEATWTERGAYRLALPGSGVHLHNGVVVMLATLIVVIAMVMTWTLRKLWHSRRVAALAVALIGGMLWAQRTDMPTVYVRDSDAMAFVSSALLDRLDPLPGARRPGVVFTGATIVGSADETHATFDLTLTAVSALDAEQIATLPVQGIALEAVTLDGVPAFPVADGLRFTLPVRGVGPHTITLRGRVPLTVNGSDREAMLRLDPLPMAKLAMTLSPLARSIRVPNREGSLRSERKLTGTTIEAELGATSPVIVRWRSGGLIDTAARIAADCATLWDLSAGDAAVTAAYSLRVNEGAPARLVFEIPANLEPGRLSIRSADGAVIGISEGTLSANPAGPRTYTVTLQQPLEGTNTVILRLVSLVPLSATPQLSTVKIVSARESSCYLLARVAGTVTRWEQQGLKASTVEAGISDLGSIPELSLERLPLPRVYQCETGKECWLRPVVQPPALPMPISEDTAWQFGTQAMIEARLHYSKAANLAEVEFDVPAGVALSDVVAPDLAGWSRAGNRVRIWFRAVPKDLTVRWFGTWALPKLPASFELPQPARSAAHRIVRLRTVDGVRLHVEPGWPRAITFTPGEIALSAPEPVTPLKLRLERR